MQEHGRVVAHENILFHKDTTDVFVTRMFFFAFSSSKIMIIRLSSSSNTRKNKLSFVDIDIFVKWTLFLARGLERTI